MRILRKCAATAGYLFMMSVLLEFKLSRLFDGKQFLLLILGAGILMLPSFWEDRKKGAESGKNEKAPDSERKYRNRRNLRQFSSCALWAGFLETFLLWLLALDRVDTISALLSEMALCLRPVFYGLCIWMICRGDSEGGGSAEKLDKETGFREITTSESYHIFQEMGLTRRETEIAIMVCQGKSNGEIAESFCISEATVKKHLSNIFGKLELSRREQIRGRLFAYREKAGGIDE